MACVLCASSWRQHRGPSLSKASNAAIVPSSIVRLLWKVRCRTVVDKLRSTFPPTFRRLLGIQNDSRVGFPSPHAAPTVCRRASVQRLARLVRLARPSLPRRLSVDKLGGRHLIRSRLWAGFDREWASTGYFSLASAAGPVVLTGGGQPPGPVEPRRYWRRLNASAGTFLRTPLSLSIDHQVLTMAENKLKYTVQECECD